MREEADEGVMSIFVAQNYGNSVEYISTNSESRAIFQKLKNNRRSFRLGAWSFSMAGCLLFGPEPEAHYFPTEIWFHVI
jgi:hypothetical protein